MIRVRNMDSLQLVWVFCVFFLLQTVLAFTSPHRHLSTRTWSSSLCETFSRQARVCATEKKDFLLSLDYNDRLNGATPERTKLLDNLIDNKIPSNVETVLNQHNSDSPMSIENPGRWESMLPVAPGTWKVVYAPHMTTMAKVLGGGEFDVQYILHEDGTMESHARLDFPWLFGFRSLYLSVSGTYASVSDSVCRVDFDESWVKEVGDDDDAEDVPYSLISDVPDSVLKPVISSIGRLFFIKEVSVFPVSFLDKEICVFDFELLGTRICARKLPE